MASLEPGQIVDGYKVQSILGQGGMGTVYKATQLSMQRDVALKVLAPELADRDPSFCHRFVEEARAAGRFNHPNIIGVHEVGQCTVDDNTIYYFVMELVEGDDCKLLLKQQGRLDRELVGKILTSIADVLIYAEQIGIVHRDIKPENIMLTKDGLVKLADLGLALRTDDTDAIDQPHDSKVKHKVMGTPRYMSPEQARGKKVDGRADQYCLGTTIYHMLTGEAPFNGKTSKELMRSHVLDPVPNPADIADVPRPWCELCMTMMAKRPDDRYPSAAALKTAAQRVVSGHMPPRIDATEIERLRPRRRGASNNMLMIGVIAAVVVLLLAFLFIGGGDDPSPTTDQPEQSGETQVDDQVSAKVARAQGIIDDLPDDDASALGILQRALRNPYFAQDEMALGLLQSAHDERQQRLQTAEASLLNNAERQLKEINALVAVGNQVQAWERLKAIPPEQQAVIEDRFQGLRQQITEAANGEAEQTRQRIDQARNEEQVKAAINRYRTRVHEDLIDKRIQVAGNRRIADIAKAEADRRQAQQRNTAAQDKETWEAFERDIRDLRGTGNFDRMVTVADGVARKLHDKQRIEAAKQFGLLITSMQSIEEALRSHVADNRPTVSINVGRNQDAQVLRLDERQVSFRLVNAGNTGAMSLDRTRPEVPYEDLVRAALTNNAELTPLVPQFLWFWIQPGGQAPQAFGGKDEGPAPIARAQGSPAPEQSATGDQAFESTDGLRSVNDHLQWRSDQAISRSNLNETDIPTLAHRQRIDCGDSVTINFALHDDTFVMIGLRNDDEAIRLAFNTERKHLTGVFESKHGKATFDGGRGTVLADGKLSGDHQLVIETSKNGEVNFILDGHNWLESLPAAKRRAGPHRFTNDKQKLQLIIQGLPTGKQEAVIDIKRIDLR